MKNNASKEFLNSLVQLSTLPREEWIGKVVYHPRAQADSTPYWCDADLPDILRCSGHTDETIRYDVGVVNSFEPDPHFHDLGYWRVAFSVPGGKYGNLYYNQDNLWIENDKLEAAARVIGT